ncbi:uncharacterized protein B0H18DRAFT_1028289 [Fomitopsis serialis]|uniref:uncharacterized protein n=1 Tax=Fomitopsis serialis TaxID=139415 RepID=UPI002007910F|nr:uncharacterized protein B0H18DRAFT_1028289 [Neoantrodia serialis]KAH9919315.1 hypothetical protein B0H18DRAFT_1028289 [Neoantrodia serialis]
MMYDRANLKMLTESHLFVDEAEWTSDAEMPWVDFQLVNFHQPVLGTFHCKFMIVDRKMAILCSNNIQDRANMEMMSHLEGPIVDSMYDTALISWYKAMNPPLPLVGRPYQPPEGGYKFGVENEYATTHILDGSRGEEIFKAMREKDEQARDEDEAKTNEETKGDGRVFISGKYETITDHINAGDQTTQATEQFDPSREFTPHIVHAPHEEVPMVLVNRSPYGKPVNEERALLCPQAAAWLAALRHAARSAAPIVDAVLSAVRRGIEVTLYVDVGFNDGGEALPLQGGTNEEVEQEKERLKYYWYTARDQCKPINAHLQQRNCHVKLMVIDDEVGIMGNGNQDVQSWYHSSEVNVMVDSHTICREWLDSIERVQNTHLHRVGHDGVYRDAQGVELQDSTGVTKGVKGLVKGIQGSIARVRGTGGF